MALASVTVVDNASGDGTINCIRDTFPEVRIICLERNVGYGAAANVALRTSTREYIVVLNQDVISTPGWIERLVAALDKDSTAGLATPRILLRADPTRVNACGTDVHYSGVTTCRGYGSKAAAWAGTHRVTAISGAAFIIRRSLAERLGGFDPLFFMYVEDADLSLRAALHGVSSLCVPDAAVLHDFEPTFSQRKIFWLECNRVLLLIRSLHVRTLLLLSPALALVEVLVLGYVATRGPDAVAAKVRAYRWLVSSAREIRTSRGRTHDLRRVNDADLLAVLSPRLKVDELAGPLPRLVAAVVNPLLVGWYHIVKRVVRW
jgi:GT2 family glycosyltransferase